MRTFVLLISRMNSASSYLAIQATLLTWLALGFGPEAHAQAPAKITVSGYVRDQANGEGLVGATVVIEGTTTGVAADINGFYSLRIPSGSTRLVFSFVGFKTEVRSAAFTADTSLDIAMAPEDTQLEEVVVRADRDNGHVSDVQMSKNSLNLTMVRKLPTVLGEVDVIKAVQAMPGVVSAGEGTSSFFVRGGSADQNLILMDGAPVFDASHLFGLYSVFNADVLSNVELYKGGIPARFGGRLSSILDIKTKSDLASKPTLSGGIGTLASRVMAEGPITVKSSYLVSARRSYADLIMKAANQKNSASFYDLNAKLNMRPDERNMISLSMYLGRDNFDFGRNFDFGWGNKTGVAQWEHQFTDRVSSHAALIGSSFDYLLSSKDAAHPFDWKSSVNQVGLQYDVLLKAGRRQEVGLGYKASYQWFEPGKVTSPPSTSYRSMEMERSQAIDQAFYVDTQHSLSDRLTLWYGIRFSVFRNVGPSTVIVYGDQGSSTTIDRKDTLHIGDMETVKTYGSLEPRFSARYLIGSNSSIKASYSRMVQNVHSVSNGTVPLPFNTWMPSGYQLRPQRADLFGLGFFQSLTNQPIEWSVEAFYKNMNDVTEFADNADLFFNKDLVAEIRQGKSWSYGAELSITKLKGRFTGSLNYTWSKVMREIPGVNQGVAYPANHDRRHVVNLSVHYEFNEKWALSSQFTYSTGRPITVTSGRYEFGNFDADIITERNGYRLPDVHRLDLAVTFTPQGNKNRRWKGEWIFSVYNVYGRKNPFTLYTRSNQDKFGNIIGDGSTKEARMISLFPIIPSITYNFKF